MNWHIHHKSTTVSTNIDAREGIPGDVFTADFQEAGRGRLDHKWLAPKGTALMMSVVVDASGLTPERVALLPLVIGIAVIEALRNWREDLMLKWPNDVLTKNGCKLVGILCELNGNYAIVGIGVNLKRWQYPDGIRADALGASDADEVRDVILEKINAKIDSWRESGLKQFIDDFAKYDYLRGREIAVKATDDDAKPICGVCEGIADDGSLIVAGFHIYAGEAHVNL